MDTATDFHDCMTDGTDGTEGIDDDFASAGASVGVSPAACVETSMGTGGDPTTLDAQTHEDAECRRMLQEMKDHSTMSIAAVHFASEIMAQHAPAVDDLRMGAAVASDTSASEIAVDPFTASVAPRPGTQGVRPLGNDAVGEMREQPHQECPETTTTSTIPAPLLQARSEQGSLKSPLPSCADVAAAAPISASTSSVGPVTGLASSSVAVPLAGNTSLPTVLEGASVAPAAAASISSAMPAEAAATLLPCSPPTTAPSSSPSAEFAPVAVSDAAPRSAMTINLATDPSPSSVASGGPWRLVPEDAAEPATREGVACHASDAGGSTAPALEDPDVVLAQFGFLDEGLRRLNEDRQLALDRRIEFEVRALEAKQLMLDRRLAEVDGQMQGLVEEHERLAQLSAVLTDCELAERVAKLETSQKTVVIGVRRALKGSMATQKALEAGGQRSDDHGKWRIDELERRLNQLTDMVSCLANDDQWGNGASAGQHKAAVLDFGGVQILRPGRSASSSNRDGGVDTALLMRKLREQAEAVSELQEQVEEIQAGLERIRLPHSQQDDSNLGVISINTKDAAAATEQAPSLGPWSTDKLQLSLAGMPGTSQQDWTVITQNFVAQVSGNLGEVRQRLDALQEIVDEKVLVPLWQVSRQVPEATGRVERLSTQCQEFYAKVESHEVRLDMVRASFDTQEQRLQAIAEHVDRALTGDQGGRRGHDGHIRASTEALTGRVDAHARAIEELREQLQECRRRAFPSSILGPPSCISSNANDPFFDMIEARENAITRQEVTHAAKTGDVDLSHTVPGDALGSGGVGLAERSCVGGNVVHDAMFGGGPLGCVQGLPRLPPL